MGQRLAVIIFATGKRYAHFVDPLIQSLREFFPPHDIVLFTDDTHRQDVINILQTSQSWYDLILNRFGAMLGQRVLLEKYDQIFHIDADMIVCSKVESADIFSNGVTATIHPSFPGTFERRRESAAYVEGNPTYYQACFWGATRDGFFKICQAVDQGIRTDQANGIKAIWEDESHFNKYLADNPPSKELSPTYAFPSYIGSLSHPETWMDQDPKTFTPKIRHFGAGKPGTQHGKYSGVLSILPDANLLVLLQNDCCPIQAKLDVAEELMSRNDKYRHDPRVASYRE
jgi:histo-blood group ABO system transferase